MLRLDILTAPLPLAAQYSVRRSCFRLAFGWEGRRPPARLAVRARLPRMRVQSASVLIDEFDADGRENGR
jgi:hypothetical protein